MIKTHRTYTLEVDDNTFEIPFTDETGAIDNTAELHISTDGTRAIVGCLCQDGDAENPLDVGGEGTLVIFADRNSRRPEYDAWKRLIRENAGFIFTVSYGDYGSSGVRVRIDDGPLTVAYTKNKTRRLEDAPCNDMIDNTDGYYIVPSDVTDPRKYAEGVISSYDSWCNGDVYGVCVWWYTRETIDDAWELTDRDECWGHIGSKWAEEELASQVKYYTDSFLNPVAA